MRARTSLLALLAVAAGLAAAAGHANVVRPPSEVIRPADEAAPLAARFDWALGRAPKAAPGKSFWVGYSIDRLMGERSHIGSFYGGEKRSDLSVADILAGRKESTAASRDLRGAAKAALDEIESKGKSEKQVLKELGFLFKFTGGATASLAEVHMSNLDLSFDFEAAPLYWLGEAAEAQSLGLVKDFYERARDDEAREGLVAAAGCHGTPALVVPFLAGVLGGDGPDDLRKDAAFWMGQQDDADGLKILIKSARSDRSTEVREGAVFAISQVELPGAVDELIDLARTADKRDVRKQAVFWIGQMASEKSGKALEEFARKDTDVEIQEQAVFALSQLEDHQGVEPLIKLAKTHPDPRIRKKAVFWLGECDDPRALETLIAIIKGK